MKKFIIAAIAIIAFTANTFAADTNDKTISLFKAAYPNATNVHYKLLGEVVSISFVVNNTSMQAFYNNDGEQVAVSRETSINRLPARAITTLNSKYPGYTTTEVIEMEHSTEGTSYYVSLEKNNQKVITQVSVDGSVSVFKKYNK
ncbi:hypothetical protein SAMN05421788_109113 [Filimonas lacunae]|uniref:Beta-lactamase-inhibitor-like, PepSY-like n=1 Tax=Filimonas lacunae TaxID=477680 RepID=A0A173MIS9_9BACT|nr:hypothetical protein [Filimonas lacunae]BAV07534.1 hypothetical protein FLA_3560 [Filimonas lacunae]SIT30044.1 hypothetical protein SAMN05421788_109113 [Filimonas lacunae]